MRARHLIPTLVVVLLAVLGPWLTDDRDECPAGTDGPQFKCWLLDHPEQLEPDDEPWDGGQPLG